MSKLAKFKVLWRWHNRTEQHTDLCLIQHDNDVLEACQRILAIRHGKLAMWSKVQILQCVYLGQLDK